MSDRELLGLAAKAAGYSVRWFDDSLAYGPTFGVEIEPGNPCGFEIWNPLADDGDALRLAVAVLPQIAFGDGFTDAFFRLKRGLRSACCESHSTENADKFSATRRAIVRAAAEIGRVMP